MKACPPLVEWEQLRSSELDPSSSEPLETHLAECDDCAALYEQLKHHACLVAGLRRAFIGRPNPFAPLTPAPEAEFFEGYRILRELSQTRFGIVYEAVQEGTGQRVALKVLPAFAAAERRSRLRFEREIELLATLRHPSIVPVYESGLADDRYYFAMPFVKGVVPDVYADRMGFALNQRLELLRDIARAIHAAHLRGVMHRDLKLSNLLVDAEGRPHVLDFGLGKLTSKAVGDPTLTLEGEELIGTPAYMSPEQAAGDSGGLDIRTDVYSLGVVLYRLLTGSMPYPTDGGILTTLRNIQEKDPEPPSVHRPSCHRDVDAIVLKALEKNREERYQSAGALADDIDRYLAHEPIEARTDSVWRTLVRSARRRPALATAAASAFIVLLVVAISATLFLNERIWRVAEGKRAQKEAAVASAINTFMNDTLSAVRPENSKGNPVTVSVWLDRMAAQIESRPPQPTEAEAALRLTIGDLYWSIQNLSESVIHLTKAYEIYNRVLGPDHPDTIHALHRYAIGIVQVERYEEGHALIEDAYRRHVRVLGESDPRTLNATHDWVSVLKARHQWHEAEELLRELLKQRRRLQGEKHRQMTAEMRSLATVLWLTGRKTEAYRLAHEALRIDQRLRSEDPSTFWSHYGLGDLYFWEGEFEMAESHYRKSWEGFNRVAGPSHGETLSSLDHLINTLIANGKPREAAQLARTGIELSTGRPVPGDGGRVLFLGLRGRALEESGDLKEALELFHDAVEIVNANGNSLGRRETFLCDQARVLRKLGRLDEAIQTARKVLTDIGSTNPTNRALAQGELGVCLGELGDREQALRELETSTEILRGNLEPGHWHLQKILRQLDAHLAELKQDAPGRKEVPAGL